MSNRDNRRGFRQDNRDQDKFAENFTENYGSDRDEDRNYGQTSGRRYGEQSESRSQSGRDSGYGRHDRSSRGFGGDSSTESDNRRYGSSGQGNRDHQRPGDVRSSGGFGGRSNASEQQNDRSYASDEDRSEYYSSDYDRDSDYGYGRGMSGTQGGSYGFSPDARSTRQGNSESNRNMPNLDRMRGGMHSGKGPQGYQRSDDRIREDVNDRLTWHGDVDASQITVKVESGEVTLEGNVADRNQKRTAEDIASDVRGVKDVHNHLRADQNLFDRLSKGINDLLNNNEQK